MPVFSDGQPYRYPVSFLNDRARDITGAAAVNAPEFVVPGGLTGEGQIVAVADSGLDAGSMDDIHPDLKSAPGKMPKVVLLKSWAGREVPDDPSGHGTHMAATIAGTGAASNGKFRGIAPGASIYFQAILDREGNPDPPANLADLFLPAYSAGARVHVNGWGGGPDTYLEPASQTDDFMRGHPDFLAIFGAGNSGPSTSTLTGEANSKNALAVGASTLPRPAFVPGEGDTTAPAEFSSRGPTGDGRIKPDLLAPASAVISARSRLVEGNLSGYQDYTRLQGTSMAAAVAGGSAALVREYFKKYMDMDTPSAALVKAALINGARTAAGGPSQDGFGIIDLAGTIIALKENTFSLADEWAGVSQGGEITYTYHVSDPAAPFKATLAWTDPPAEAGSARTLINNLDLTVRTPDGMLYYGNHFLGANTQDKINNVEQIYLPSPTPGDYTVTVTGSAVNRNSVRGSSSLRQDFALIWGQVPAEGMVQSSNGSSVKLTDGSSFNIADTSVVNLVNDEVAPADAGHLFTGAAVYRAPQWSYITSRVWRATGVRALKMADDIVFTESDPAIRTGGFSLAPDNGDIVLNNSPSLPDQVPPGIEINAVINPLDQKLRQVHADYTEVEGVISSVQIEKGQKTVYLAGGRTAYRILPGAIYSYADTYANAETADAPFGTGVLDEMAEALPGMPVRLHLAPSSGGIQYLAVKRTIALGTVSATDDASGEIYLDNGYVCRIFPGAYVKKDKVESSLEAIKPGDHISAVLLPGNGQVIGLVAYSSVFYGKAIDFTKKNRKIYMLDDNGRYLSLYLPEDAVVYRWGVKSTIDAIASGNRIRITTNPEGEVVWQLDIADTIFNQDLLLEYDKTKGVINAAEGRQYRVTNATRYFKNAYQVTPDDLLPGEYIKLEYAVAPPPTGNVLISVNASSAAQSPLLLASAVPLQDRLVITGRTSADTAVHVWNGNSSRQVNVDEAGKFSYIINRENVERSDLSLVAVNRKNGGVTGIQLSSEIIELGEYESAVAYALSGVTEIEWAGGYLTNDPISRVEAAAVLARLLCWPKSSEWALPFSDAVDIPAVFSPAVAEAKARGILKGYPDGSFQPASGITRAEAAVILAALLNELGVENNTNSALPYWDASDIPPWAVKAVSETTSAGIFADRAGDSFAPWEQVTAAEFAVLLERLLSACETKLEELR
ncbi:S8 family serine peptidase [Pelotomaculum propionicicum]|uniref:S8 family serine peptidase n=1 Tax=Pelotomaculum propionicicum TaxID=258475 RepID=UPI003BA197D8